MIKVYTSKNVPITLPDTPMAKGGEGAVYKTTLNKSGKSTTVCVKIYHNQQKMQEREARIKYMVNNPPPKIQDEGYMLGWPLDWVTDKSGFFLGFVMPLGFPGSKELVNLTVYGMSRKLRNDHEWCQRYDLQLGKPALLARLKLICNIAIPVHILHSTGKYVLEDFKPQNILVTKEGKVTIVDMDSVQISSGNRVLFPGTAATPEYLPPEYYNKGVGKTKTTPIPVSWDNFAVGIVFYQLLLGIHPYTVMPKVMPPDGNCGPVQNVPRNLFPFGSNANQIASYAAPHKKFQYFPQELKTLFIRSFTDDVQHRPNADEWGRTVFGLINSAGTSGGGGGGKKKDKPIPVNPKDYVIFMRNQKFGFSDKNGNIIIAPVWAEARPFHYGVACVKNDKGHYGFIDGTGMIVIPCKWKSAEDYDISSAKVTNDQDEIYYVDKKNNIISGPHKSEEIISNNSKGNSLIENISVGLGCSSFLVCPLIGIYVTGWSGILPGLFVAFILNAVFIGIGDWLTKKKSN